MPGATLHSCVQVNVAIMLAPVAFLGHITSQPVEAMARMETDRVSPMTATSPRLHKPAPRTLLLHQIPYQMAVSCGISKASSELSICSESCQ